MGGSVRGKGWVEVPRGRDLTCLLFCSYALTPAERRLTKPPYTGAGIQCLDSALMHSAVHLMP